MVATAAIEPQAARTSRKAIEVAFAISINNQSSLKVSFSNLSELFQMTHLPSTDFGHFYTHLSSQEQVFQQITHQIKEQFRL